MDAQNLNLTVTAFTTVVVSILAWVLPFYVYLKIYATLIKQALKLILIERILLQYASKKLATYFSGILDTRKSYSAECILSFRVVTAILQHDTEGIFYKQLLRDSVISRTLSILDELSSSQSANIEVEKKEQLVGGAALAMMWVLLRCGQIAIDEDTNDFIYPSNITQHQGLGAILQQLLRRRSSNRDLCDDIIQYLTQISLETDYEHLMPSANKICSLVRVILEVDRCVPDNRDLHERFFSQEFIDVVLNLVTKEIHILENSNNRNDDPKMRSKNVRRLRSLLRLLSLSPWDGDRRAELEARLVALFRDSNHHPRLDVEDFDSLSKELSSVTSLPATKIFVDRHAVSIPEQLQRAEEDSYRMQNVLAELERNLTQSRLLVEERDRELEVLRPKLLQKEVETRAQQSTMTQLEEHLTRSRALANERDLSLRTILSRLQLEQEESRELENSLVEREIVVTELRAAAAEKERALEALQSQLLLQQEEAREWQNMMESHRAQSELDRDNTMALEIALASIQEEATGLRASLAEKEILIGEMQTNLTQSLAAVAEWDKVRPKVATMTCQLQQSKLRNEQYERQVQYLEASLVRMISKVQEKEDESNITQGELLRLRVALQAQTVMKAPRQSIISIPPRTQNTPPGGVIRRWSNSDASCLRVLEGHVRDVRSVCVSPDGSLVASGSLDGDIRVWSMLDGSCVKHLLNRTFVYCVCFSPDGNSLASTSKCNNEKSVIKIWSLTTGMCISTIASTIATENFWSNFNWLCYSPDGRSLVSGSSQRTIQLWSIPSMSCLQSMEEHDHEISAVCFSPDGSCIASGSYDHTIRLWSLSTGSCSVTLRGHTGKVMSVCFSPDGSILASSSEDHTIRLWTLSTGSVVSLLGHNDWVQSVSFSPDGSILASASRDATIRIWSVASGSCMSILRGHIGEVLSVCFSPDGSSLVSGGGDNAVRVWSTSTELHVQSFVGHTSSVYFTCFSPDCSRLATGSLDATIRIWSLETGVCEHTLAGHGDKVYSICFSPDGASLASGSGDNTIRIWSLSVGSDNAVSTLTGHSDCVQSVCYSSSGDTVASGSLDATIRIWSVSTGGCIHTLTGHTDAVCCVCYCSDGIRLASGSADRTIRMWSLSTGSCMNILTGHSNQVNAICFSPDGGELVTASADHTVRLWKLWSLATGSCVKTCDEHTDSVYSVCFSPDGTCFASGSVDHSIRIWSTSTTPKESIRLLTHHSSPVRSVCFSSDGYQLASGSDDSSIIVFGERATSP